MEANNARDIFVVAMELHLQESPCMSEILREKCSSQHPFLKLCKQTFAILFNIFAKNEAKKYNSKIYAAKKRQPGAAGDAANRKIKKLQSNS